MRARRSVVVVLASVFVLLLSASCKKKPPKAGETCTKEGDFVCADEKTRMACHDGQWVLEHCMQCLQTTKKGCGGSSSFSSFMACSPGGIGPEGAPCRGDTWDCDEGGKTLVRCIDGAYRRMACRGKDACRHTMTGVSCDQAIAEIGDACAAKSGASCTSDHKALVRCTAGKFEKAFACSGTKGCHIDGEDVHCDAPLAEVGAPCKGGAACSADGTSMLQCKDGKMVVHKRCRGKDPRCVYKDDTTFNCAEPGPQEAGDPCESGNACTADGKSFLTCKDGRFAVTHACKRCSLVGEKVTCTF